MLVKSKSPFLCKSRDFCWFDSNVSRSVSGNQSPSTQKDSGDGRCHGSLAHGFFSGARSSKPWRSLSTPKKEDWKPQSRGVVWEDSNMLWKAAYMILWEQLVNEYTVVRQCSAWISMPRPRGCIGNYSRNPRVWCFLGLHGLHCNQLWTQLTSYNFVETVQRGWTIQTIPCSYWVLMPPSGQVPQVSRSRGRTSVQKYSSSGLVHPQHPYASIVPVVLFQML